jgi:acetylornithine deacetylase
MPRVTGGPRIAAACDDERVDEIVARVLAEVDAGAAAMLAEVADLVRVPSVSGSDAENEAQQLVADRLRRTGYDVDHWRIDLDAMRADPAFPGMEVERHEAWGVVGRLPGSGDGPTLMLNGHVDVVPTGDPEAWNVAPFAAARRHGRMYGRGVCDMKAGLTAAICAVDAIRAAGVVLRGDVIVTPVQGEEDGGLGTFALLRRGWRADACVIAEPTDLDVIAANSGALTFRLRVRGAATHAARRTEGVSAIEKFWPVWQALDALERRRHLVVDPLMERWPLAHPLSIGTVTAGDWASSVPDLLVAEGRLGVALDEPVADARGALEATIADLNDAEPWFRDHPVEVEWWGGQFASGRLPVDSDLGDRVRRAHTTAAGDVGTVPASYGAPYGSDLRLLAGVGGVPTVQYGPGDARLAHGPHESVALDDIVTTARTLAVLALDICGT